jgi:hypothetical protein
MLKNPTKVDPKIEFEFWPKRGEIYPFFAALNAHNFPSLVR